MDVTNIGRVFRNPQFIFTRLHWEYNRKIANKQGVKVMEEDWDNLIILDACRYDLFERKNTIEGMLDQVISAGSHTVEFLHANFGDEGPFYDTVYITATPQLKKENLDNQFHDVFHLWRDHWDEDSRTVQPETVANLTREIEQKYPNKRLISHFVQPHYPFIGEKGRKLDQQVTAKSGLEEEELNKSNIWDHLRDGTVSKDLVKSAYEENLDIVLPVVKELVSDLEGKTVVTSDHGNIFGRWGIYGHPGQKFLSELVTVPWLELDYDSRKIIKADGKATSDPRSHTTTIEDRLSDLGYL